jgi:cytochrome b involved in lipid metabolism
MIEDISKIIITIDDYRFDITDYAKDHPGGYKILKKYNGKDEVSGHCESTVVDLLDVFCIGKI